MFVKARPKTFLLHRVGVEAAEGGRGYLPVERGHAWLVRMEAESIKESGGPALGSQSRWGLGVAIVVLIASRW